MKQQREGFKEVPGTSKRGLIAGYKPNRISLYILLLTTNRLQELFDVLYKDMEEYKEDK
mgnify:CR=1 FL=1